MTLCSSVHRGLVTEKDVRWPHMNEVERWWFNWMEAWIRLKVDLLWLGSFTSCKKTEVFSHLPFQVTSHLSLLSHSGSCACSFSPGILGEKKVCCNATILCKGIEMHLQYSEIQYLSCIRKYSFMSGCCCLQKSLQPKRMISGKSDNEEQKSARCQVLSFYIELTTTKGAT